MPKTIFYLLLLLIVGSCSEESIIPIDMMEEMEEEVDAPPSFDEPNILLIIADDLGLDAMSGYSEGSVKPSTPHLDELRLNGLKFNNFWTNSVCSPTRATILTGKYGYRNGVTSVTDEISMNETSLHSYISQNTNQKYSTALIGKWHLFGGRSTMNPEEMGIGYFSGLIGGGVSDYYSWPLYEDGTSNTETVYATSKFTDLAIDWIDAQNQPWFLWLAYNAPHTPFHVPPAEMHSQGNLSNSESDIDANPLPYYLAAIEAMDYQIGRLLEGMDADQRANTMVIFIGDNGTPGQVAQSPYSRMKAKGSLYQGGINNPMIVSGAGVSRSGEDDTFINSTDLFATIASVAGAGNADANDSKNFSSLFDEVHSDFRNFTYAEYKDDNDDEWCIRSGEYKLIISNNEEEFYNITDDPYENNNLLMSTLNDNVQLHKDDLLEMLQDIRN